MGRRWGWSWLPPWLPRRERDLRARRSRQPAGEPSQPPTLAADPLDSLPSGIRSLRSAPRRSLRPLGLGEIREDGPPTHQAIFGRATRPPASPPAARAPRAATLPHRRAA